MEKMNKRLRKIRRKAGMSQLEVARAVNMSRTGYAEIEHGVSIKTFEKLPRIAKALGCRIDDLFPEMDEQENLPDPQTADDDLSDLNL